MEPLPVEILLDLVPSAQHFEGAQFAAQIVGNLRLDGDGASRTRLDVYIEFLHHTGFGEGCLRGCGRRRPLEVRGCVAGCGWCAPG